MRTTAYRGPRRIRGPPGALGCDVFREARAGPLCWSALSKRVCGLENLAAMLCSLGSRASTDGKFSAKWLLETSRLAGATLGPREGHMTRMRRCL